MVRVAIGIVNHAKTIAGSHRVIDAGDLVAEFVADGLEHRLLLIDELALLLERGIVFGGHVDGGERQREYDRIGIALPYLAPEQQYGGDVAEHGNAPARHEPHSQRADHALRAGDDVGSRFALLLRDSLLLFGFTLRDSPRPLFFRTANVHIEHDERKGRDQQRKRPALAHAGGAIDVADLLHHRDELLNALDAWHKAMRIRHAMRKGQPPVGTAAHQNHHCAERGEDQLLWMRALFDAGIGLIAGSSGAAILI
ncbi:hypothetical protein OKW43_002002 [Paraburkholderia sp. WC7.3g]